jgi:CBS domain-containing protein
VILLIHKRGKRQRFPELGKASRSFRVFSQMDLSRNFMVDSVSRLHPTGPRQVAPQQTVREAVELMQRERVGCLVVCENEKLKGIFTERDLLRRVLAAGKSLDIPVSECMTTSPAVVDPREAVSSALRRMEEGGYRHLPVVEQTGKAVGILSVKRIVHYVVEHFPKAVYNLPPDPAAVPTDAEGA